MTLPFVIGAYASHPAPELEADYYRLLADQPWVSGVEIPYPGQLATQGDVLAGHLAAHWDFNTITAIPGTMQNVWKNENFGLASPDEAGRAAALDFTSALRDDLAALCERAGRQLVARVQLHSAPTRLAQVDAFKRSLAEVATWDWCGATLVIEHCDKYIPEQNPEKGFLSLESEIDVVSEAGIGIHLNWGRSAVEGRSADTAYEHVLQAGKRGVLDSIIFSGAGPEETQYGYPWIDGHLPAQADEPTSLMNEAEIARCAQAAVAGGAKYLGAKVCVPKDASLEQRLAMLTNIYRACGVGE